MNTQHIDSNSLKHFSVCLLLSLLGPFGLGMAVGAAITKEYLDRQSYGHWCWWDITFDALGIAIGFNIYPLLAHYLL